MILWGHLESHDETAARYRYTEQKPDDSPDPEAGVLVVPADDWTAFSMEGRDDTPAGALRIARKATAERDENGTWPDRVCWFSC